MSGRARRPRPSHFKTRGRLTDRLEVESRLENDNSCGFAGERRKILLRGLRGASLWRAFPRLRGFFKAALWIDGDRRPCFGRLLHRACARADHFRLAGADDRQFARRALSTSLSLRARRRGDRQYVARADAFGRAIVVRSDDSTILAAPRAELSVDLRSLLDRPNQTAPRGSARPRAAARRDARRRDRDFSGNGPRRRHPDRDAARQGRGRLASADRNRRSAASARRLASTGGGAPCAGYSISPQVPTARSATSIGSAYLMAGWS